MLYVIDVYARRKYYHTIGNYHGVVLPSDLHRWKPTDENIHELEKNALEDTGDVLMRMFENNTKIGYREVNGSPNEERFRIINSRFGDLLLRVQISVKNIIHETTVISKLLADGIHLTDVEFVKNPKNDRLWEWSLFDEPLPVCGVGNNFSLEYSPDLQVENIRYEYVILKQSTRAIIMQHKCVWNGYLSRGGGLRYDYLIPFSEILTLKEKNGEKYYKRLMKARNFKMNLQLQIVCEHFPQLLELSKKHHFLKDVLRWTLKNDYDFIKEI